MVELAEEFLNSPNKKDRMWAFDRLTPYVFRRQPQAVEGGDPNKPAKVVVEFLNAD
jgi:hypothetical protein